MGIVLLFLGLTSLAIPEDEKVNVKVSDPIEAFALGKPQQTTTWASIPNVRVCATSEVSLSRIYRALGYWERLGYDFGIVRKDYLSTCMNPRHGEIIVTLPEVGFSSTHMGATRLYTDKETGKIVKAKIFILPKYARKDIVLEHEIGHALGWSHYRQRYHMMHPTWMHGGFDSYGLRQK